MKRIFLLGCCSVAVLCAQDKPANPPVPRDTHGVDMRTQSGPPGPEKYSPPSPLDPKLPTFWLIGDSTVRNGSAGDGTNLNQWGWGAAITFLFDPAKVNVVNRALGGTSARSFYNNNWKKMVGLLKTGDVLIMQFGTNDGGVPTKSVGELKGIGEETEKITNRAGQPETIYTYGWYLRQMISEAKAHGTTPIVCSLIPRKSWDDQGHLHRAKATYAGWASEVAQAEKVGFVDLNELSAERLDQLGKAKVDVLYVPNPSEKNPKGESVHTGWDGAVLNAQAVVEGLKALPDDPVAAYFK